MRNKNFDADLLKTLNEQPMPAAPLTDDEFARVLDAACAKLPQAKKTVKRRFPWGRVAAAAAACMAVGLGRTQRPEFSGETMAAPILTVTLICPPGALTRKGSRAIDLRRRSATCIASSGVVSGNTTTNSSPPMRLTRSKLRRFWLMRSAKILSVSSPTPWP